LCGIVALALWAASAAQAANRIYWSNDFGQKISYANLDGSGGANFSSAALSGATVVDAAGKVDLLVKSKGKAKKKLRTTGKVMVGVTVTFTPNGVTPTVHSMGVKLEEKAGR
jgi:hypothetical protein